jgi:hypothetical protein
VAAGKGGLWYWGVLNYHRRKGEQALRWVEAACSGKARVSESRWINICRLQATMRFAAHWFENARVTVRLLPRPIPFQWLLCLWRQQHETLTFEADLDYTPGFHLDVFRHRWLTYKHRNPGSTSRHWQISRPGPVVLTTRTEWSQELAPVVNTLMTSRGHNLVSVRFRPESPHLVATVPLDALSDEETAAGFLSVLRDLAAGASTSRQ